MFTPMPKRGRKPKPKPRRVTAREVGIRFVYVVRKFKVQSTNADSEPTLETEVTLPWISFLKDVEPKPYPE